jgi:SAM-dependent methyltransferase
MNAGMTQESSGATLHQLAVQPPRVTWPSQPDAIPPPAAVTAMRCPNCGGTAGKHWVLDVSVQPPEQRMVRLTLLRCPDCDARFYDNQTPPDYAEPSLNLRGRVPFYVQQGAGVSLITKPLAQIRKPAGSRYMEVGCGYGFGLDFAIRAKGWEGVGIDPAPLSALGRDQLNLPIELRYLREDDEARGTMDVVMGSEVIEHVTSPAAFVRTLRAMLKPGGVMILTTPNAEHIVPETPPGVLVPLLSPSLHLVMQNRASLGRLLEQGGFTHVQVETDSHSLVAFASDQPFEIETDRAVLRDAYRAHLEQRARSLPPESDLFLAYAGRALQESVNDGEMAAAQRAWDMLLPACRARFGIDLGTIETLPPGTATSGLEAMARLVPLNLGGLLYAGALLALSHGTPRPALERRFLIASNAANAMRRALGELAMEDGMTEDIGWTAMAEAVLCAASAGSADIVARVATLPPAPADGTSHRRRRAVAERALVGLVNAGHYKLGRALAQAERLGDAAPEAPPQTESNRDTLFVLAILDLQPEGNPARAVPRFAAVRASIADESAGPPPIGSLYWAAVEGGMQACERLDDEAGLAAIATEARALCGGDPSVLPPAIAGFRQRAVRRRFVGLVNSGEYDQARKLMKGADFGLPSEEAPSLAAEDRDLVFCLAVLDLQKPGNPGRARRRFSQVRRDLSPRSALYWAALRGELQAMTGLGRPQEARALKRDAIEAGTRAEAEIPEDLRERGR